MCYSNNDEHRISSNVGSSGARQYNIATKNSSIPGKDKYLSLKNGTFLQSEKYLKICLLTNILL